MERKRKIDLIIRHIINDLFKKSIKNENAAELYVNYLTNHKAPITELEMIFLLENWKSLYKKTFNQEEQASLLGYFISRWRQEINMINDRVQSLEALPQSRTRISFYDKPSQKAYKELYLSLEEMYKNYFSIILIWNSCLTDLQSATRHNEGQLIRNYDEVSLRGVTYYLSRAKKMTIESQYKDIACSAEFNAAVSSAEAQALYAFFIEVVNKVRIKLGMTRIGVEVTTRNSRSWSIEMLSYFSRRNETSERTHEALSIN